MKHFLFVLLFSTLAQADTPPRRPNWSEVSATTAATTTSTTDVLLTGMSITVPMAGTFVCWFDAVSSNSATNNTNTYTLYNGSTAIAASQRLISIATTVLVGLGMDVKTVATHATFSNITAGTVLSVYWHTNGGTATTSYRTFTCTKGS